MATQPMVSGALIGTVNRSCGVPRIITTRALSLWRLAAACARANA